MNAAHRVPAGWATLCTQLAEGVDRLAAAAAAVPDGEALLAVCCVDAADAWQDPDAWRERVAATLGLCPATLGAVACLSPPAPGRPRPCPLPPSGEPRGQERGRGLPAAQGLGPTHHRTVVAVGRALALWRLLPPPAAGVGGVPRTPRPAAVAPALPAWLHAASDVDRPPTAAVAWVTPTLVHGVAVLDQGHRACAGIIVAGEQELRRGQEMALCGISSFGLVAAMARPFFVGRGDCTNIALLAAVATRRGAEFYIDASLGFLLGYTSMAALMGVARGTGAVLRLRQARRHWRDLTGAWAPRRVPPVDRPARTPDAP